MNLRKRVGKKVRQLLLRSLATDTLTLRSVTGSCAACAERAGRIKKFSNGQAYPSGSNTGFYKRETEQENMNRQTVIATAIAISIMIGIAVTVFWPLFVTKP